jgi:predicted lipid-binding transport protein (Tim44 family)
MVLDNPLNSSSLVFPILECFHIAGFAVAIGTAAIVDLRLLNIGLRDQTPAQLSNGTASWMLGGLIAAIFSGLLLFSTDPDMYYLNWSFLIKMACLTLAIAFHYTIHRKTLHRKRVESAFGRLVACVSLTLWISIIFGGIFIASVRPGLG